VFYRNATAAIVTATPEQKPPNDWHIVIPSDGPIALWAARTRQNKPLAGPESIPHYCEKTSHCTPQKPQPDHGTPPQAACEHVVRRLERNTQGFEPIRPAPSVRHSR